MEVFEDSPASPDPSETDSELEADVDEDLSISFSGYGSDPDCPASPDPSAADPLVPWLPREVFDSSPASPEPSDSRFQAMEVIYLSGLVSGYGSDADYPASPDRSESEDEPWFSVEE